MTKTNAARLLASRQRAGRGPQFRQAIAGLRSADHAPFCRRYLADSLGIHYELRAYELDPDELAAGIVAEKISAGRRGLQILLNPATLFARH